MIEPSENNPIFKLEPFLWITGDDSEHMDKYKHDLIYHFERRFYNLASFSFHYLYMTVIHAYLLKFHKFDELTINSIRCQAGQEPIIYPNLGAYAKVRRESQILHLFEDSLDKTIKDQHEDIVRQRNEIAHSCGRVIELYEFEQQVKYSCGVLSALTEISLNKLILSEKFKQSIDYINSLESSDDTTEDVIEFIKSFYISQNDFIYLHSINSIDFSEYSRLYSD